MTGTMTVADIEGQPVGLGHQLTRIGQTSDHGQKVDLLRRWGKHPALQTLLRYTIDPGINWLVSADAVRATPSAGEWRVLALTDGSVLSEDDGLPTSQQTGASP